jgi:hypothetical protein
MVSILVSIGLVWVALVILCALFFAGSERVQSS